MTVPVFPIFTVKVKDVYVIAGGGGGDPTYGKKNGLVVYDLTTYDSYCYCDTGDDVIDRIDILNNVPNKKVGTKKCGGRKVVEMEFEEVDEKMVLSSECGHEIKTERNRRVGGEDVRDGCMDALNRDKRMVEKECFKENGEFKIDEKDILNQDKTNTRSKDAEDLKGNDNMKLKKKEDDLESKQNIKESIDLKRNDEVLKKQNLREEDKDEVLKRNNDTILSEKKRNLKIKEDLNLKEGLNQKEDLKLKKDINYKENDKDILKSKRNFLSGKREFMSDSRLNLTVNNTKSNEIHPKNIQRQPHNNSKAKIFGMRKIFIAACGLRYFYIISLFGDDIKILQKYELRVTCVYFKNNCIILSTQNKQVYGILDFRKMNKDHFKGKINNNTTIPINENNIDKEIYTYTIKKNRKTGILKYYNDDISYNTINNCHSFFIAENKIHKIVIENNKYNFTFLEKKKSFEDEICEIFYNEKRKELVFFTRGKNSRLIVISHNKEEYIPLDKITALSCDDDVYAVATGTGFVHVYGHHHKSNVLKLLYTKKIYNLPLTSVACADNHVYFTSFNGLVDRKKMVKRNKLLFFIVLMLAVVLGIMYS